MTCILAAYHANLFAIPPHLKTSQHNTFPKLILDHFWSVHKSLLLFSVSNISIPNVLNGVLKLEQVPVIYSREEKACHVGKVEQVLVIRPAVPDTPCNAARHTLHRIRAQIVIIVLISYVEQDL